LLLLHTEINVGTMKKLIKKYTPILFGLLMSSFTSCIISSALGFVGNTSGNFFINWIKEGMTVLCLAVSIATFVPLIIRKGIIKITED